MTSDHVSLVLSHERVCICPWFMVYVLHLPLSPWLCFAQVCTNQPTKLGRYAKQHYFRLCCPFFACLFVFVLLFCCLALSFSHSRGEVISPFFFLILIVLCLCRWLHKDSENTTAKTNTKTLAMPRSTAQGNITNTNI